MGVLAKRLTRTVVAAKRQRRRAEYGPFHGPIVGDVARSSRAVGEQLVTSTTTSGPINLAIVATTAAAAPLARP